MIDYFGYRMLYFCQDGILRYRDSVRNRSTKELFPVLIPVKDSLFPYYQHSHVEIMEGVTFRNILQCLSPFKEQLSTFLGKDILELFDIVDAPEKLVNRQYLYIEQHLQFSPIWERKKQQSFPEGFLKRIYGSQNYEMLEDIVERNSTGEFAFENLYWSTNVINESPENHPMPFMYVNVPDYLEYPVLISKQTKIAVDDDVKLFNDSQKIIFDPTIFKNVLLMENHHHDFEAVILEGLLVPLMMKMSQFTEDGYQEVVSPELLQQSIEDSEESFKKQREIALLGEDAIAKYELELQQSDLDWKKQQAELYAREPFSKKDQNLLNAIASLSNEDSVIWLNLQPK